MHWLSEETKIKGLIQNKNSEPYPHSYCDNFLSQDALNQVITAAQSEPLTHKTADLFSLWQSTDLQSSEQKTLQEIREFFASDEFIEFMEKQTELKFKRGAVDTAVSCYKENDVLLPHDDQLDSRNLAFLLYLEDMGQAEGGALDLFDSEQGRPKKVVESIIPKKNRFAYFHVSEISFHQVSEVLVDKNRLAIGGWLHARE